MKENNSVPSNVASARAQFDRQAQHYNERWASWSDETLERLLELADPKSDWKDLDVATGTGFTAFAFAPRVSHVTGSDVSPKMLAEAKKRADASGLTNVSWVEAPAESLPFADGFFDLVTVRIAPHHFADVPSFLAEARRVLKPEGVFALADTTVPDDEPEAADWQNAVERERDASHVANLSPETWRRLVGSSGFVVTDLDHAGGGIGLELSAWLETAGCVGERAARVRELFTTAPESARRAFQITTGTDGETRFVWQRVVLRAVTMAQAVTQ